MLISSEGHSLKLHVIVVSDEDFVFFTMRGIFRWVDVVWGVRRYLILNRILPL